MKSNKNLDIREANDLLTDQIMKSASSCAHKFKEEITRVDKKGELNIDFIKAYQIFYEFMYFFLAMVMKKTSKIMRYEKWIDYLIIFNKTFLFRATEYIYGDKDPTGKKFDFLKSLFGNLNNVVTSYLEIADKSPFDESLADELGRRLAKLIGKKCKKEYIILASRLARVELSNFDVANLFDRVIDFESFK
ncbi:MAG: hypothetical protein JSV96_02300 [Candidatus Aminicenantes bacterium]|nr:MAG: hypothetical protein JSV96_02300 [Candidatus Aminicenantes bacterium]